MPTISKEVIIRANKGASKTYLSILFIFSFFCSYALVYSIYLVFTKGDSIIGACVLSAGLLVLLYKLWRHFYNEITNRIEIVKTVEENLYYVDIHRSINGMQPLNIKID